MPEFADATLHGVHAKSAGASRLLMKLLGSYGNDWQPMFRAGLGERATKHLTLRSVKERV